jgi:steroid delta-isomerase-like uncharacterized protein
MSIESNKALVRRFVDEVFVKGNMEAIDDLVASDFVGHTWAPGNGGREELKRSSQRVSKALDDVTFVIHDLIAEGDRVAFRVTASATQVGEFIGLPASGRRYTIGEIHIVRIEGDRVAEHWHYFDQIGLMHQLRGGVTPATV